MSIDPEKLKLVKEVGRPEICFSVARAPNSSKLCWGGSDGKTYDADLAAEKMEVQASDGHSSYVSGCVLAGTHLVTGGFDCKLVWRNAETREIVRTVEAAHAKWIRKLAVTPDGKTVISVADDMVAKMWNAETGELLHTLVDHKPVTPNDYPSMLYAVTVSADGTLIATGDKVGHIAIWETATGNKVGEAEAPGLYTWDPTARRHSIGGLRSLAFSLDNTLIAAGGIGKIGNVDHLDGPSRLEISNWKEGKKLPEIEDTKMKGLIEKLAFLPEGGLLVGAGGDHGGFLNFYNVTDGKLIKQEKAPMHVHDFVLNETGDTLYMVGHGRIAIWEFKAA